MVEWKWKTLILFLVVIQQKVVTLQHFWQLLLERALNWLSQADRSHRLILFQVRTFILKFQHSMSSGGDSGLNGLPRKISSENSEKSKFWLRIDTETVMSGLVFVLQYSNMPISFRYLSFFSSLSNFQDPMRNLNLLRSFDLILPVSCQYISFDSK